MLTDRFGRFHNYLRIALTDNCNFRCTYCLPDEKLDFLSSSRLMSPREIERFAQIFVDFGVTKIRLTGGEPLVRKEASEIISLLSAFPVELTLTTNGVFVDDFINDFKKAGIRSLNVSLDTLNPEKFQEITRRNLWEKVWSNILLLLENGFHVKVNTVVMKGVNENEIPDFIEWTRDLPLHIRFIEFMPFKGNRWGQEKVFTLKEMIALIETRFTPIKLDDQKNDTAKKFFVPGFKGTFAIISTMSEPFCEGCNRIRLTADGKIKNCLFSNGEIDLLNPLRQNQDVGELIRKSLFMKEKELGGQLIHDFHKLDASSINNRSMIAIGG